MLLPELPSIVLTGSSTDSEDEEPLLLHSSTFSPEGPSPSSHHEVQLWAPEAAVQTAAEHPPSAPGRLNQKPAAAAAAAASDTALGQAAAAATEDDAEVPPLGWFTGAASRLTGFNRLHDTRLPSSSGNSRAGSTLNSRGSSTAASRISSRQNSLALLTHQFHAAVRDHADVEEEAATAATSVSLDHALADEDLDDLLARLQAGCVDLSGPPSSRSMGVPLPAAHELFSDDEDDEARAAEVSVSATAAGAAAVTSKYRALPSPQPDAVVGPIVAAGAPRDHVQTVVVDLRQSAATASAAAGAAVAATPSRAASEQAPTSPAAPCSASSGDSSDDEEDWMLLRRRVKGATPVKQEPAAAVLPRAAAGSSPRNRGHAHAPAAHAQTAVIVTAKNAAAPLGAWTDASQLRDKNTHGGGNAAFAATPPKHAATGARDGTTAPSHVNIMVSTNTDDFEDYLMARAQAQQAAMVGGGMHDA